MKEALQKVEVEEQTTDTKNSEPVQGFSKFFDNFRYHKKYALESCYQWYTGCLSSYLQSIQEDYREQAEHYTKFLRDYLKSIRLTMVISNISNILNIVKFIIYLYNNIVW